MQHDKQNCWYDFDDRHVHPLPNEASIKTSAAYVLFYRRVQAEADVHSATTSICDASLWRGQAEGSDAQSTTTSHRSSPQRDDTSTSIDSPTRSTPTSMSSSNQSSVTSTDNSPTKSAAAVLGSSAKQSTATAVAVVSSSAQCIAAAIGSTTEPTNTLIRSSSDHNPNSLG